MRPNPQDAKDRMARKICIALAITMLVCGGVLGLFARSLGPPVGDLTRIGGLSERQFGWQRTAEQYAKDHFRKLPLSELIADGSRGGIVVFGDSFTDAEKNGTSWLNSLYEQTGAAIDFVEYAALTDVLDVFNAPAIQARPPKGIILQMAERTVFRRAQPLINGANCALPAPPKRLDPAPDPQEHVAWKRRENFDGFDEMMSWGALALRRRVLGVSKTVMVNLERGGLFSSNTSEKLLIYDEDITQHEAHAIYPLDPKQAERGIICALRHTINAAPEGAEVYVVVAPDKRTMFEPWIVDSLPKKVVKAANFLPGTLNGRFIDLFEPLRKDVLDGRKDVYFPNDTHWNDATARKVGEIIAKAVFTSTQ